MRIEIEIPKEFEEHFKIVEAEHINSISSKESNQSIRNKAIDDAMVASAKAICAGCGYLNKVQCTYEGCNCRVSKPMLGTVIAALEQLKAGEE